MSAFTETGMGPTTKEMAPGEFTLLPEGWYLVILDTWEMVRTEDRWRKFTIRYQVIKGEHSGDTFLGQPVTEWRTFGNPKTKGFNKHWLHMIGHPYEGEPLNVNPDLWQAAQVWVKIKHKEYKDKMYANVVEYKAVEPPSAEPDEFKNI